MPIRNLPITPIGLARRKFLQTAFRAVATATLTGCGSATKLIRPVPPPTATVPSPSTNASQPSSASTLSNSATSDPSGAVATPTAVGPPKPGSAQPTSAASSGVPTRIAGTRQPNVILITVDTLRADHIGAYGLRSAQTPTLDRLAREGARFDR